MSEKYEDKSENKVEVNFVNIGQTHKPVVDFAGMLVVGVGIEEFPELSELPDDSNE